MKTETLIFIIANPTLIMQETVLKGIETFKKQYHDFKYKYIRIAKKSDEQFLKLNLKVK